MVIKKLLFVFSKPPYNGALASEGLDAVLAASVFEQDISVLFTGDGIYQLLCSQNPKSHLNHQKKLAALPMYEVTNTFVDISSLVNRNVEVEQITKGYQQLNRSQITELINTSDHVFSF